MSGSAHKLLMDPDGGACSPSGAPNVVDDAIQLVIDPFAGLLEAVNLPGRRFARVAANAKLPVALDTAMPGLRRLRAISDGAPVSTPEELLFWFGGRPVRVSAEVLKETMNDGRSRMVVRALNAPAGAARDCVTKLTDSVAAQHSQAMQAASVPPSAPTPSPAPSTLPPATGTTDTPAPAARDDRETLREIARRIRAGHTPPAPEAAHDPSPPPTPAPSRIEKKSAEEEQSHHDHEQTAAPQNPAAVSEPPPLQGHPLPPRSGPAPALDSRTLSKVAHELKTPLSAIVAAAEIMRDEQLGPMGNQRYRGYAGDIHESARHALDVINAMLGAAPREMRTAERVDLNSIVTSAVSALTPLATASTVGLEADTTDGELPVRGDATGIRQIIYNLVSNALKFTPAEGYVHVATGLLPDGSPYFVVRDTGEGMTEDEIVQAFYAEATGPRRGGGYGIGLPMVRRLAEAMGASIDVDSSPGKGTVVLVSFPFEN